MNSIIINRLGLVIISVLVMMALLSCTKVGPSVTIQEEVNKLDLNTSLDVMLNDLRTLADNIEKEQEFFKHTHEDHDHEYNAFVSELEYSFDDLEKSFSITYSNINNDIESLEAKYTDEELESYLYDSKFKLNSYAALFRDLLSYHYMILETDLVLNMFTQEMINLMNYSSDGNLTSIEYNNQLEFLMAEYSDLLVVNDSQVLDDEFLYNQDEIDKTLESIGAAKVQISEIETTNEVDELVNESVLNMFMYIEQSVKVVDKYVKRINKDLYTNNNSLKIEAGSVNYLEEILIEIEEASKN